MKTLEGVVISNVYVLALLLLSTYLYYNNKFSRETTRKLVHIGASNWWFIAMWYFDTAYTAAIVPVMFAIVNILSLKVHLFRSIEREEGKGEFGRLYYALSILFLSVWTFGIGHPEIGGIGVLVMGYVDGFAALVGIRYGKHLLYGKKTVEGTLAGALVAAIIVISFNYMYKVGLSSIEVGAVIIGAVFLEMVSSKGTDNLTVPIGTAILVYLLM